MDEGRRKFWVLGALAAIAVPLMVAATAFACANLATIKSDKSSGTRGTTVSVRGFNFTTRDDASAVQMRMNSRRGQVLWEGRADRRGRISAQFKVPDARVGRGFILATQTKANGRPAAGTPARHPFRVRRSGSSSSSEIVPVAWASPQQSPPPSAGPASIPVTLIGGVGVALLALSAAGLVVARVSRRPARAGAPRVRPAGSLSS